ncbi:MAG TPA: RraA family protein [Paracoccaceae bacterium]|nr:RraA family protein [Paracoccaceae bacterium]
MATGDATPIITVKRSWERPDTGLLERFRDRPTGNVSDAAGRAGALAPHIKPVTPERRFLGPALTIDCGRHDNLAFLAALESVRPGDVMMVATQDHPGCAVVGDLLAAFARNRGAVAIVTDGMVRDVEGLAGIGLPVFAAGIRPSGPTKRGPGSVGLPVWLGGQRVEPGDLIVGDSDGVVVVPRAMLAQAAEEIEAIAAKEAVMEADGRDGLPHPRNIEALLGGVTIQHVD